MKTVFDTLRHVRRVFGHVRHVFGHVRHDKTSGAQQIFRDSLRDNKSSGINYLHYLDIRVVSFRVKARMLFGLYEG